MVCPWIGWGNGRGYLSWLVAYRFCFWKWQQSRWSSPCFNVFGRYFYHCLWSYPLFGALDSHLGLYGILLQALDPSSYKLLRRDYSSENRLQFLHQVPAAPSVWSELGSELDDMRSINKINICLLGIVRNGADGCGVVHLTVDNEAISSASLRGRHVGLKQSKNVSAVVVADLDPNHLCL